MEKRKIVLIGSAHPLRGGLATFNERLIREYLGRGDDASIFTFSLQYPRFLFPGKTQYSSGPAPSDIPIHVRINSINPLSWIKTGRELSKIKPDLVIIKYWMSYMAPCLGTIARIIRKNKHSKVISVIDNIIPHEKRPWDKFMARYFINSVDAFVVMSQNVLEDLNKILPFKSKPVEYCAHPLYDNFGEPVEKEIARKNLNLDPAFHYILFFGFIRDYKGLDILLKAFADPRLRKYRLKLLVAGEFYCDPKPYYDIIEQNNLNEIVVLSQDFIPDTEVAHYFCASDLVVQTYKSATQSGVSQIAYYFNKPIITTDVGGLAEFFPDGKVGYVVKPDVKEIADAILRFYDDNKEEEFSKNAALEKIKYSWVAMIETIDKLVKS
jgi:D-inositol-3-phosphate glycosyltransferase